MSKESKHWSLALLLNIASGVCFGILIAVFKVVCFLYLIFKKTEDRNAELYDYHENDAITIDKRANVVCGPLLNKLSLADNIDKIYRGVRLHFGHHKDTISAVLGILFIMDALNKDGMRLYRFVNWLFSDPDHCIGSVDNRDLARIIK